MRSGRHFRSSTSSPRRCGVPIVRAVFESDVLARSSIGDHADRQVKCPERTYPPLPPTRKCRVKCAAASPRDRYAYHCAPITDCSSGLIADAAGDSIERRDVGSNKGPCA